MEADAVRDLNVQLAIAEAAVAALGHRLRQLGSSIKAKGNGDDVRETRLKWKRVVVHLTDVAIEADEALTD